MGRDLALYVLSRNIEHDKTKMCIDLEFEPEKDEIDELIYRCINPDEKEPERTNDFNMNIIKRIKRNEVIQECTYKYVNSYVKEDILKWCPKCCMYARGLYISNLYDCSIVKTSINIGHSYSNPIWNSKWNIKDLYIGDSMTDFCKRFESKWMYREITADEFKKTKDYIAYLGEPIRTSDKDAYNETLDIFDFIEKNLDPDNIIIFEDEL